MSSAFSHLTQTISRIFTPFISREKQLKNNRENATVLQRYDFDNYHFTRKTRLVSKIISRFFSKISGQMV